MSFPPLRRTSATLALLVLAACALDSSTSSAAPPVLQSAAIGLGGEYKLGRWTELSLAFELDESFSGTLGVTVPDGDGVPVEQRSAATLSRGQATLRVPVRLGRPRGEVRVRLYAADTNQPILDATLPLVDASAWRRRPAPLALPAPRRADERIIVAFGAESGLDDALRALRSRGRTDADRVYARIDSFEAMPQSRWGYDGLETVVLTPGDAANVSSVSPEQWRALVEWTELGGRVAFVGGVASEALLGEQGPLARLAPGKFDRLERLSRLRGAETLAAVDEPLPSTNEAGDPLTAPTAFFRDVEGRIVSFEGVVAAAGTTIVRYPVLLGETTYVAYDLSRPPFAGWVGREGLWRAILARDRRAESTTGAGETSSRAVHLGYDDLSGQVRTTLERFEGVRLPSFLAIVAVLILYLAWIGPGDWFFLRRFVGRMEWTWATFAIVLLLIGAGMWLAADFLRGSSSKRNQLDLVDVAYDDQGNAAVRGWSWSVAYSDAGRKYDLAGSATDLVGEAGKTPVAGQESSAPVVLSWEGLAGRGVGAMSGAGAASLDLPRYELLRQDDGGTTLRQVPVPIASTKAFVGRWSVRFQAPPPSDLYRSRINDLLRGDVTNPLPYALEEARIISGSWVYTLGGDLEPGETWSLSELDSPMNLEWRLQRRRTTADNRDETETWNPTHASYERLVEMLMFHRAAGGRSYSADLGHDYYPQLDLSDRLEHSGAMLIGRIAAPALEVSTDPQVFSEEDLQVETWVRIVLPVAPAERR